MLTILRKTFWKNKNFLVLLNHKWNFQNLVIYMAWASGPYLYIRQMCLLCTHHVRGCHNLLHRSRWGHIVHLTYSGWYLKQIFDRVFFRWKLVKIVIFHVFLKNHQKWPKMGPKPWELLETQYVAGDVCGCIMLLGRLKGHS